MWCASWMNAVHHFDFAENTFSRFSFVSWNTSFDYWIHDDDFQIEAKNDEFVGILSGNGTSSYSVSFTATLDVHSKALLVGALFLIVRCMEIVTKSITQITCKYFNLLCRVFYFWNHTVKAALIAASITAMITAMIITIVQVVATVLETALDTAFVTHAGISKIFFHHKFYQINVFSFESSVLLERRLNIVNESVICLCTPISENWDERSFMFHFTAGFLLHWFFLLTNAQCAYNFDPTKNGYGCHSFARAKHKMGRNGWNSYESIWFEMN